MASCLDPAYVDDGGHGTHVAGTVAAAANGVGVTGVAPNVDLVNLEAGQDSGYFFLEPTLDALTYAADTGIDVVNMSFFVDPWLYNCRDNPADSPAAQAEQRTIVAGHEPGPDVRPRPGVTLVAALGNEHTDLGKPAARRDQPRLPAGHRVHARHRQRDLPVDADRGQPRPRRELGRARARRRPTTPTTASSRSGSPPRWLVPRRLRHADLPDQRQPDPVDLPEEGGLQEEGTVDADGNIVPGPRAWCFKDCTATAPCGYYTYLQGTSMASPHAAGVAALAIEPLRQVGTAPRQAHARPGPAGVDRGQRGDRARLPEPAAADLRRTRDDPRSSTRCATERRRSTASTATASSTPTAR